MVFDTFDQPGKFTVTDFFPFGAKIIITSRHGDSMRLESLIEIGAMTDDEGIELILRQTRLNDTAENREHARWITQELGGLALAIDQAATYMSVRKVPLPSFSGVYKQRRAAILRHVSCRLSNSRADSPQNTCVIVNIHNAWSDRMRSRSLPYGNIRKLQVTKRKNQSRSSRPGRCRSGNSKLLTRSEIQSFIS